MGNFFGLPWSASYSSERNEVTVNLGKLGASLPFRFHSMEGSFYLPFNLGRRVIQVGDLINLARTEIPLMARLEVDHSIRKVVVPANVDIDKSTVDRLAVGISQPISKEISSWSRVRRVDTDLGIVVLECRVVSDVTGILKLGVEPGWFTGVERRLIGEAEGSLEVYIRARFEREEDRFNTKLITGAATVLVTVPVLLFAALRYLTSHGRDGEDRDSSSSLFSGRIAPSSGARFNSSSVNNDSARPYEPTQGGFSS